MRLSPRYDMVVGEVRRLWGGRGVVAGEVEMEEIEGAQGWGWALVSLRRRQRHRRGRCDVLG